jgi:2-oxoglutarate dehydrogenase E2 component (dihydrolipoamide succinyltransferase)
MHPVTIPTINNNDSEALLIEWRKQDGSEIQAGDILAVLETTKSTYDLVAEQSGILQITAAAKQSYKFGTTIAHLFGSRSELATVSTKNIEKQKSVVASDLVITKAAQKLIEEHSLQEEQIRGLGKSVIKAADLEPLLAKAGQASPSIRPSAQQLAIGRTVSRSHSVVPKSFIVKKVYCDKAIDYLAEFTQKERVMAGIPDLLVFILRELPSQFPFFFGSLQDDSTFVPSTAGNIGVTFDLGHGLFIPVIKETVQLSLNDIAKKMMGFRMKAMRKSFRSEELSGGDISISINMDVDTLLVIPIILQPQTCMLSLGAIQSELALNENGVPVVHRYFQLGAAFDHRVINGFEANAFLNAIKKRIESLPTQS